MVRTHARCTTRPSRIVAEGARHRPLAVRPRGGRALAATVLVLLALSFAREPLAAGAETDSTPLTVTPFDIPGRELVGPPGDVIPRPADLALVFYDPQNALPRGFDRFATEVQTIFRGLGIEASWRVGGNYGESEIPEVPVILLSRDPAKGRGQTRIMGLVRRDQVPQRAVWLFMEGVRFALGYPPAGDVDYEGAIARALARVAAHEIVHAIAPDEPHAADGLMRHALDKRFLLGKRATIDGRPANTLSFHLKELTHAGLVTQERSSRNIIYRAAYDHMNALLGYLTENCCQGTACEVGETAASCKR